MIKRYRLVIEFVDDFVRLTMHIRELILLLLFLIVTGGFVISELEGIKLGDALYFAFITGLSVGYGDIAPTTTTGKIVSVAIGLVGTLFVGLTAAVATHALADTVKRHRDTTS
jgi:hypothetical protein